MLNDILAYKQRELAETMRETPVSQLIKKVEMAPPIRSFSNALGRLPGPNIIAEVKFASPSKGMIREHIAPETVALQYKKNGAAAISVLTERHFFQGHPEFLKIVRQHVSIPVLRKDFVVEEYQLFEARALGADAVLLIVAALQPKQLSQYVARVKQLGMDCLVEVHDAEELKIALDCGATIIGINNRNLKTFQVSLLTTLELVDQVPNSCTIVSESGIHTHEDLKMLQSAGVNAALIGEVLMRNALPGAKLAELLGVTDCDQS